MADLAEFVKAPDGTQWHENTQAPWKVALIGDRLHDNYESEGSNYKVRLFGEAEIHFDEKVTVTLDDICEDVYYRKNQDKGKVTASGPIEVEGVAVKAGGSVAVTCSARGGYRPPEWQLYQ